MFPVCKSSHFLVICINTLKRKITILDNKPLPKGIAMKIKYADIPTKVVNYCPLQIIIYCIISKNLTHCSPTPYKICRD